MNSVRLFCPVLFFCILFISSCNGSGEEEVKTTFDELFSSLLPDVLQGEEKLREGKTYSFLQHIYEENNRAPLWVDGMQIGNNADSIIAYLSTCYLDGLFKEDYHYDSLIVSQQLAANDSLHKLSKTFWVKTDVLLTKSFVRLSHDLQHGRLLADTSDSWKEEDSFHENFCGDFSLLSKSESISAYLQKIQPTHIDYVQLKKGVASFVRDMDKTNYTAVAFPYKDSIAFIKNLYKRLQESGVASSYSALPDSANLTAAIKKYQIKKELKVTGTVSAGLIQLLNDNDMQRYKRIAVALDKYKSLPAKMPEKYIWINLPAFALKVVNKDTIALTSKVIVGKSFTSTPEIISNISDIIIYPTWTVPTSIVKKEMIPGMQRNLSYLARRNMYLIDSKGRKISPQAINWTKYKTGIPYMVQQASGDNNALGIIKFNFKNKHSVYLHDTNQRYLYDRKDRDLSHGCVRVQEFKKLAYYIADNDSIYSGGTSTMSYTKDSIDRWLSRKINHKIVVKKQIPLFIQYIGCEFVNGQIKFYRDIYNEDAALSSKYFSVNKL